MSDFVVSSTRPLCRNTALPVGLQGDLDEAGDALVEALYGLNGSLRREVGEFSSVSRVRGNVPQ